MLIGWPTMSERLALKVYVIIQHVWASPFAPNVRLLGVALTRKRADKIAALFTNSEVVKFTASK